MRLKSVERHRNLSCVECCPVEQLEILHVLCFGQRIVERSGNLSFTLLGVENVKRRQHLAICLGRFCLQVKIEQGVKWLLRLDDSYLLHIDILTSLLFRVPKISMLNCDHAQYQKQDILSHCTSVSGLAGTCSFSGLIMSLRFLILSPPPNKRLLFLLWSFLDTDSVGEWSQKSILSHWSYKSSVFSVSSSFPIPGTLSRNSANDSDTIEWQWHWELMCSCCAVDGEENAWVQ